MTRIADMPAEALLQAVPSPRGDARLHEPSLHVTTPTAVSGTAVTTVQL